MADKKIQYATDNGNILEADDTAANRQKISGQGWKIVADPQDGVIHTIGEFARGVEESIGDHAVTNYNPLLKGTQYTMKGIANLAGSKPSEELKAEAGPAKFHYTTDKGNTLVADDTPENRKKVADLGWQAESAAETASRNPEFQGARGFARNYLENVGDTLSAGLAHKASTKEEQANYKALDEAQPVAGVLGTGAAIAGLIVNPVGGAAKVAAGPALEGTAGRVLGRVATGIEAVSGAPAAAEAGVLGKLGVEGTSIAGKAIGGGVRGTVYAAPKAAGEVVFDGDPLAGGETLALGFGIGAFAGGGTEVGRRLFNRAGKAADSVAGKAQSRLLARDAAMTEEAALAKAAAKAEDPASRTLGDEVKSLAKDAGNLVKDRTLKAIPGVGTVMEEPKRVADLIATSRRIAGMVGKQLDGVPTAIERLGDATARNAPVESFNSMARFVGLSEDAPRHEQFQAITTKLADYASNPEKRAEKIGQLAGQLEGVHPDAVYGFTQRNENAIGYLHDAAPKDPTTPEPFTKSTWVPSDSQLSQYERKVQVALDPFSVMRELQNGTLTKEHVEAADALWPSIMMEIRKRVVMTASSPKPPMLSTQARRQLDLLMKATSKARSYQSFYDAEAEAESSGTKKMGTLPGTTPSPAQKLATGR